MKYRVSTTGRRTGRKLRTFQIWLLLIVKEVPPWLNVANFFTLARLAAVPFAVRAILVGQHGRALAIVLAAGLSDTVDGALARRFVGRLHVS